MSSATKALPAGWGRILDEMHARLDQAIASADARIDQAPAAVPTSDCDQRLQELARWSERVVRLQSYLESAEQVIQSVDELLGKEESLLQQTKTACTTLRQRLAEGTGGAIG